MSQQVRTLDSAYGAGRTRSSGCNESAFVGFDDGAGVVCDQPPQHGIGVLGVAQARANPLLGWGPHWHNCCIEPKKNVTFNEPEELMVERSLVDAVEGLDLQPRRQRWRSLSYCVLDAVWSIGALYDSVVAPLVWRVAAANGDSAPLISLSKGMPPDPLPLPELLRQYPDTSVLQALTNSQRTSPRAGIPKADAALRFARILVDHDVLELHKAEQLLTAQTRCELVDADLAIVPGDGIDGIRRGYLWMLIGNDELIKPDRMVLRWLARQGQQVDAAQARVLIKEVAQELTRRLRRHITPWMVDHAIWIAERSLRRRQS